MPVADQVVPAVWRVVTVCSLGKFQSLNISALGMRYWKRLLCYELFKVLKHE